MYKCKPNRINVCRNRCRFGIDLVPQTQRTRSLRNRPAFPSVPGVPTQVLASREWYVPCSCEGRPWQCRKFSKNHRVTPGTVRAKNKKCIREFSSPWRAVHSFQRRSRTRGLNVVMRFDFSMWRSSGRCNDVHGVRDTGCLPPTGSAATCCLVVHTSGPSTTCFSPIFSSLRILALSFACWQEQSIRRCRNASLLHGEEAVQQVPNECKRVLGWDLHDCCCSWESHGRMCGAFYIHFA